MILTFQYAKKLENTLMEMSGWRGGWRGRGPKCKKMEKAPHVEVWVELQTSAKKINIIYVSLQIRRMCSPKTYDKQKSLSVT